MIMITQIATETPQKTAERDHGGRFLNECGNPSDRSGPDLTQTKPIKSVAAYIKSLRTKGKRQNAAFYLIGALKASGISVHAGWNASLREVREGTDQSEISIQLGFPCDAQEELRKERYDVLVPLIKDLRGEMIEVMFALGAFSDLRPFGCGKDAVAEVIAAGARIYKLRDGDIGLTLPIGQPAWEDDHANGWRLRRAAQRFMVSLHHHRDEIGKIVESLGRRSGSGYSLESLEANNAS